MVNCAEPEGIYENTWQGALSSMFHEHTVLVRVMLRVIVWIEKVFSFQREVDENAVFHFSLRFSYLLLTYIAWWCSVFLTLRIAWSMEFCHESYDVVHFTDYINILGCFGAITCTASSSGCFTQRNISHYLTVITVSKLYSSKRPNL